MVITILTKSVLYEKSEEGWVASKRQKQCMSKVYNYKASPRQTVSSVWIEYWTTKTWCCRNVSTHFVESVFWRFYTKMAKQASNWLSLSKNRWCQNTTTCDHHLIKTKILYWEPFFVISIQIGCLSEHLAREVHWTPSRDNVYPRPSVE